MWRGIEGGGGGNEMEVEVEEEEEEAVEKQHRLRRVLKVKTLGRSASLLPPSGDEETRYFRRICNMSRSHPLTAATASSISIVCVHPPRFVVFVVTS